MPQLAVREEISATAVEEIKRLHGDNVSRAKQTIDDAIRIGEILSQIKEVVRHGSWIDWVQQNCPFGARQAQKYISIYDRREQIKNDLSSHLDDQTLISERNGEHPPPRLHESNFFTKSVRSTQTLMGDINHELKDRPIQSWGRDKWISLAAALEPLAELYSKLKTLIDD